ncbi:MAG: undecaprenyldiphospho-muramoylpentapeptide beta-N-acetylglucosaminyltransferase [Lentimicrobiaceae bacterium]|jgi:UDP-N-acetylglucosamine--N-acetylmuramyl-(pentapeptide) pyrophosphoryl-undecaprenol N-acetylglucosamine transferase|nr:undecaprenyldiphospho-muramoylpentapeptide beta-N-acetylglucosaminyltransferase [Lentimicrobiaceae bacterium]
MQQRNLKIIISGGGTGGHIFPAIAVANAIKALQPSTEILFVGAKGRMEMEKVPQAGFPIEGLWISGFQRKLTVKNLLFPIKLIHSLLKAKKIIRKFAPNAVAGFGGYASGPILKAAAGKHIPMAIWEGNSFAGVTNKLLARSAEKIFVAYSGMEKFFPANKLIMSGNPVRKKLVNTNVSQVEALRFFGLPPAKTLLVIGGSLGAFTINASIRASLEILIKNNISVIWQTGKLYFDEIQAIVNTSEHTNIRVFDFIQRMDMAYTASDIVISRAGALSISELCVTGKPAVLVPSPNVAEDHQTKNAKALFNAGAALMIKDTEAVKKCGEILIALFEDENKRAELSHNILKLALPAAAEIIADEIIKMTHVNKINCLI